MGNIVTLSQSQYGIHCHIITITIWVTLSHYHNYYMGNIITSFCLNTKDDIAANQYSNNRALHPPEQWTIRHVTAMGWD